MTREELNKRPLYLLGVTATIPGKGKMFPHALPLPEHVPGVPLDYKAILAALLGLGLKDSTTGNIHRRVEDWYTGFFGESPHEAPLQSLSARHGLRVKADLEDKVRKALGISEELWEQHDNLHALSAKGSMTEEEFTADKIRKALGISEELWNKHCRS